MEINNPHDWVPANDAGVSPKINHLRRRLADNLIEAKDCFTSDVGISLLATTLFSEVLDSFGEADLPRLAEELVAVFRLFFDGGGPDGIGEAEGPRSKIAIMMGKLVGDAATVADLVGRFNRESQPRACLWFRMPDPTEWEREGEKAVWVEKDGWEKHRGPALPMLPTLLFELDGEEGVEERGQVSSCPLAW